MNKVKIQKFKNKEQNKKIITFKLKRTIIIDRQK